MKYYIFYFIKLNAIESDFREFDLVIHKYGVHIILWFLFRDAQRFKSICCMLIKKDDENKIMYRMTHIALDAVLLPG